MKQIISKYKTTEKEIKIVQNSKNGVMFKIYENNEIKGIIFASEILELARGSFK
jgi:hypothetical protein